jgi:GH25 family lysozyme M1 (1,4-beta-N-acetylmuramidase)
MLDWNYNLSVNVEPDFEPLVERNPADFGSGKLSSSPPSLSERLRILVKARAVQPANTILGVDLSHYNGVVDYGLLRESGVRGVVLKCSESTTYKDTLFESNWMKARDEGLAVMVYHFFRDKPGDDEFSWFMRCAQNFLDDVQGNTAVALDVETDNGVTPDTRADRAFSFCVLAQNAGLLAGIYCSPGLVSSLFPTGETRWSSLDFQWVAHWTSASTYTLPAGWSRDKVRAWQFGIYPKHSWAPTITGDGAVDCNWLYFPGEDDLKQWLGQEAEQPYPFPVQVYIPVVVREAADDLAEPLWVAPEYTGLLVDSATDDLDGKMWYHVGSGWIPAINVHELE